MIRVNGTDLSEYSKNLLQFLQEQGYQTNQIAVERNGEIIPKSTYQEVTLQENDVLEIVSFVAGG